MSNSVAFIASYARSNKLRCGRGLAQIRGVKAPGCLKRRFSIDTCVSRNADDAAPLEASSATERERVTNSPRDFVVNWCQVSARLADHGLRDENVNLRSISRLLTSKLTSV